LLLPQSEENEVHVKESKPAVVRDKQKKNAWVDATPKQDVLVL